MNKSRFIRKGNSNKQTEAIKEKYDQFLILVFQLLGENLEYKEKTEIIQSEYASITDPNIERNEVFLQRIINLKNQMQAKPDDNVVQYFIETLLLLYQANIISHIDYFELIDLQRKPKAPIYPPQEPATIVKSLSYIQKVEARQESQERPIEDRVPFKTHAEFEEASLMQYIDSMLETSEMRKKKETILAYIGDIINKINFDCLEYDCQTTFTLYGSHVNEISLPSSDIDISLDTNYEGDPRDFLRFFLREIKSDLEARYDIEVLQLLSQNVSVPVIEIMFKEYDVTISFSMNNKLGAINSRLLKIYSRLDKRCKTLCLAVKLWAKAHEIISAKENFLSSYAYNLMVINFLQTRDPPILPSLQKLRRENLLMAPKYITIKRKHRDGRVESFKTRVDFEDDMVKLYQIMKQEYSDNKTTVIDLLKDFFKFYGNKADFEVITLSIKEGKHIKRDPFNQDRSFFYSIEDPFDRFRNAGRHIKKGIMHEKYAEKILNSMQESRTLLDNSHILEIFGLNIDDDFEL